MRLFLSKTKEPCANPGACEGCKTRNLSINICRLWDTVAQKLALAIFRQPCLRQAYFLCQVHHEGAKFILPLYCCGTEVKFRSIKCCKLNMYGQFGSAARLMSSLSAFEWDILLRQSFSSFLTFLSKHIRHALSCLIVGSSNSQWLTAHGSVILLRGHCLAQLCAFFERLGNA